MTRARHIFRPEVLLIVIVGLTLLRPGDVPWVNDEPIMMEMAIRYNRTASDLYGFSLPFTPSPYGLVGTRGERYGPLPIWLDQIFLAFTTDLRTMVLWRAAIFSSIIAVALICLARALRLSGWYAAVTMLSPWLWYYSRSLWDSTWCIPLSAGFFAGYAKFLFRQSRWGFRLSLICALLLPMVHLMSMAIILPTALHLVLFHRRDLWAWKWDSLIILIVWGYLFWPYLAYMVGHRETSLGQGESIYLGWLFPLLGGQFLTLGTAGMMPANGWQTYSPPIVTALFAAARAFTWLAFAAVWLGMLIGIPAAWKIVRSKRFSDPFDHLCFIAVIVWLFQTVIDGVERVYGSAHYYGGTWIVFVFFGWIGARRIQQWLGAKAIALLTVYATCLLAGIVLIAGTLARNSGTQGIYFGTSAGNQIEVIRQIQRYSDQSILDVQYPNWQKYPLAMKVLMELNPPHVEPRPVGHLIVAYRKAFAGDARIEVRQVP